MDAILNRLKQPVDEKQHIFSILKKRFPMLAECNSPYSALKVACKNGNNKLIDQIMIQYPDIDYTENNCQAYQYAITNGHDDTMSHLNEIWPETREITVIPDDKSPTPESFLTLKTRFPFISQCENINQAIMASISNGHLTLVESLLDLDIEYKSDWCRELAIACENGHLCIVEFIVRSFPEIDLSFYSHYCYEMACLNGWLDIAVLLIRLYPRTLASAETLINFCYGVISDPVSRLIIIKNIAFYHNIRDLDYVTPELMDQIDFIDCKKLDIYQENRADFYKIMTEI